MHHTHPYESALSNRGPLHALTGPDYSDQATVRTPGNTPDAAGGPALTVAHDFSRGEGKPRCARGCQHCRAPTSAHWNERVAARTLGEGEAGAATPSP